MSEWPRRSEAGHTARMLDVRTLKAQDIRGLAPEALVAAAEQMLQRISAQSQQLAVQAQAIKFKDTKLEKITFELARLKASRFGAKTEAMNAEQRQMFDEAMAEDQASLEAHLLALQGAVPATGSAQESRHAPAPTPATARAFAPRGASPRVREHHLPGAGLRPADGAHRPRRERAPGHRSGRSLHAPPHPL